MHNILYGAKSFRRQFSKLKNLYAVSDVKNKSRDGELSYPKPDSKSEAGMAFELQYVVIFPFVKS
jgi:hypothetical protein